MNIESRKYRLKGIAPILGSIVQERITFEEYLATKGKTEEERARAKEDAENIIPEEGEVEERVTGFYKDENGLILKDYQIKGFLKEAGNALKKENGVSQWVSRVDNFVFVGPRNIPLMKNGAQVKNPESILTRPLRGMTAQGPRVSIAKSEMVDEGWYIDIEVKLVKNEETKTSKALSFDVLQNVFEYGSLKGLLQWRNAGYGAFTWEYLEG